jgi:hypothetical protein
MGRLFEMANHPGRKGAQGPGRHPIFAAELAAVRRRTRKSPDDPRPLTQTEAGKLVNAALKSWQNWEGGQAGMSLGAIELWCIAASAEGHLPPTDPFVQMWVRPSLHALLTLQCVNGK